MAPRPLNHAILSACLGAVALAAAYFVAPFEGERLVAFQDGAGVWTICRGHTKGVYQGMTATHDQCDQFFAEDMADAEKVYDANVHTEMPRNTKITSIDYIFNLGSGRFKKSTLLKKLNARDRAGACSQYERWKYQGAVDCSLPANDNICGGLWNRRQQERSICMDDNYYSRFLMRADGTIAGVR